MIGRGHDKPRLIFTKGPAMQLARLRHRDISPKTGPDCHFGNGNGKAAIADVMRRADAAAQNLFTDKAAIF